jgi:hypothetical protein
MGKSGFFGTIILLAGFLGACGGSHHHAKSSPSSDDESASADERSEEPPKHDSSAAADSHGDEQPAETSSKDAKETKDTKEPEFTENMSVDEAIRAVPPDVERRNIDQETLGKPLQDLSVYEPCKPGSARVKLRVAVWNGKAVGIDVSTTPKNDKLAQCIKSRVAELTWDKKVKSLNTIEYQF